MTGMGMALMGTGVAKGENRALEAAQRAIASPLLEETSIEGAKGVLLNVSGGSDLTLHEVAEACQIIQEAVDADANIISGMVIDDAMEDEMKITVIATGFNYQQDEEPFAGMRPMAMKRPVVTHSVEELRETVLEPPVAPVEAAPPEPAAAVEEKEDDKEDIPFFKRVLAQHATEDSGGFGPNWSGVDDYDIPTVLRKQMD